MSHQVIWSKIILEEFISSANLTKEEEIIMRTRVKGWSRVKQAAELNMSIGTVDKIISRLKVKYDCVQKNNPLLPPRKFSAQETYMDTAKEYKSKKAVISVSKDTYDRLFALSKSRECSIEDIIEESLYDD